VESLTYAGDTNGLERLSAAERMLAEVVSAQDAIQIRDMAEAARVWAQRSRLGTSSINHATAIKLKAEMRIADLVDEGQAAGQIATADSGRPESVTSGNTYPSTLPELGLTAKSVHEARRIRDAYTSESVDELVESANEQDKVLTRTEFVKGRAHVAFNGGENEWYTPGDYIEAARKALGGIDLDPASSALAQETVKAGQFFTKDTDGLKQAWHGNVWMNPPYAQPLVGQFVDKLCTAYGYGDVQAAIVLVNNATETAWGQQLLESATAVVFPKARIRFLDPNGKPGAPLQGQMFVYLGGHANDFAREFCRYGVVLRG
jgi:hypothetical protein